MKLCLRLLLFKINNQVRIILAKFLPKTYLAIKFNVNKYKHFFNFSSKILLSCLFITLSCFLAIFFVSYPTKKPITQEIISSEGRKNAIHKMLNSFDYSKKLIAPPHSTFDLNHQNLALDSNSFKKNHTEEIRPTCNKNAVFVSNEETEIYTSPTAQTDLVFYKNGKQYFLDPRFDLEILETTPDWVKVRTLLPNWPPELRVENVWVKKDKLANSNIDDDTNNCLYIDFEDWKDKATQIIDHAKTAAYNVLKNDKRCNRIVNGGFLGAGQRFYLTCYPSDGAKPYHYWFSLLTIDKKLPLYLRVDEDKAASQCNLELEKTIKNNHILDNLYDASTGLDDSELRIKASSYELVGESWRITIYYNSKDSLEEKAYCYVDPSGRAEITIF